MKYTSISLLTATSMKVLQNMMALPPALLYAVPLEKPFILPAGKWDIVRVRPN